MLFKKQRFDWLLVGLLVFGLFLYASYQPRFRLRPVMPPNFIDEPLARAAQNPNPEGKVASAYWNCLASTIQWQYGYGHTLPADPPPDFTARQARASLLKTPPPAYVTGTERNTSGICRPHGRKTTSGISSGRQTGFKTAATCCTMCSPAGQLGSPPPPLQLTMTQTRKKAASSARSNQKREHLSAAVCF